MPVHLNFHPEATCSRAYKFAGAAMESITNTTMTLFAYISGFLLNLTLVRGFIASILIPIYLYQIAFAMIPHMVDHLFGLFTCSGRSNLAKKTDNHRWKSDTLAQSQLEGTYRFKPHEIFHVERTSRGWMSSAPWAGDDTQEFTVCGASVRYIHIKASYSSVLADGKREHRPIVFLHGNPSWSYLWRNVFPSLLERGHDIYAIDWIGHGRSDKVLDKGRITFELHMATLQEFFKHTGVEGAIVAAHDWGGCIALSTIPRLPPGTVDNLFLLNSFFPPRLSDSSLHYRLLNRIWSCTTSLLGGFLPISLVIRYLAPHLSKSDIDTFAAPYVDLPRSSKASIERFAHTVPSLPRFILFTLRQTYLWKVLEGFLGPEQFNNLNVQARLSAQDDQVRSYWSNKEESLGASTEVAVVFGASDPLVREYKDLLARIVHPERMVKWAPRGVWIEGAGHMAMEGKQGEVAGLIARFARGEGVKK
ncbi:haloalkane dehalogenase family protein [Aspergillus stella-maris]|uniref:haloalkane dehalogenase family protein n=1 Tax=Aspergillus stella-maris TaxID=1810926 RepID=UPI003CCCBB24